MFTTRFFRIHQYDVLGQLIQDWANGTKPRPAKIKDLEAVLQGAADIGPGFDRGEDIHYADLPANDKQLCFVIPAKEDIAGPVPSGTWPLPTFYSELAFNDEPVSVSDGNKAKFKSSRIADYSASKCM